MNLAIKNATGMLENVIAVRYFKFNGVNYLIFTKNEVDEAGYQKLYIAKINNMIGNTISDEVEWNLIRDTIKVIAKANKENTILPVQDLNENDINGIQIIGQKPFKLTSTSVSLLAANKNIVNTPTPSNVSPLPVVDNFEINNDMGVVNSTSISNVEPLTSSEVNNFNANDGIMNVGNMQHLQQSSIENTVLPTVEKVVPVVEQASVNNVEPVVSNDVSSLNIPNNISSNVEQNNLFEVPNFETSTVVAVVSPENTIDYKKMYEEQTLKLNSLTSELDRYKDIIEQLKNILQ